MAKSRYKTRQASLRLLAMILVWFVAVPAAEAKKEKEYHTPRYYASRAETLQENESWDASKREIDAGLELYPEDADLRYLNGRYYYYALGDLQQARYNFVKSIQENDQHFRSRRMLVDVEDEQKHYSSAICYINELLEFQPYDRDLWRRKIGLYNKIGQKVEADQALERLARIFPDDSLVRREFSNRNRDAWNKRLQTTTINDAATELERWIDMEPDNLDYYFELIRLYQRMGSPEQAIGTANRGLAYHPGNQQLIRVAAGIMAEMGNYTRAMAFLREKRVSGPLYIGIMREAANDARWRDPYEANGRLYASSGDREALNYVLNTALTRGYYSDAIDYLNEAYKIYGRNPNLLIKHYALEKRFGHSKEAMGLLEELYKTNPEDPEIMDDYAALMLTLANNDIEQEQWIDAYNHLNKAISLMKPDTVSGWPAAVSRQISVLGRLNRLDEARDLFKVASETMPMFKDRFGYAYEEIAALRIKELIENENYVLALKEAEALLEVVPGSEVGLRTAINMAQTLDRKPVFIEYADIGYRDYPDQPYFIIKKATALKEQGNYVDALALLKPGKDEEYINPQIKHSFVGMSEEYAGVLLGKRRPEEAMARIDTALYYDEKNTDLLYMKGLAYGQMREFGLAWEYQHKYYNPSNAEQQEWYQQMRYLKFRSYKNRIDLGYAGAYHDTHGDGGVSSIGHLYSLGSITYSYLGKYDTYSGTITYKGVDGYQEGAYLDKGGFGFEFMLQWDHVFNARWSGYVNASYSTKFFNKLSANVGAHCNLFDGWAVGLRLGYKLSAPLTNVDKHGTGDTRRYNIFFLTPSAEKAWDRIRTSATLDLVLMGRGFYYNLGLKGKLFVNEDNISSVGVMAGFGSFPEINFFDQFFNRTGFNSFSHTNIMAGIEGIALVTNNFFVSVAGTWNTYYNPLVVGNSWKDYYKNVFGLNLGLHLAF